VVPTMRKSRRRIGVVIVVVVLLKFLMKSVETMGKLTV
jgi:hypothetical protein